MQLVLATNNEDKIREIKHLLDDLPVTILTRDDFLEFPDIEETGDTLEANAELKATGIANFCDLPALADDTGLEVDALDGRPGVYSARYAGEGASYEENTRKLLEEMAEITENARGAQFRTVAAFVTPAGSYTFEGICRGRILEKPRGDKGFGYDPVFVPENYDQTFAELEEQEKNRISHRGRAIQRFHDWLEQQTEL